ncbi:murein transglycosylase [Roseococcus sp. SYP-B2431]|uniref:lytic transglycosylase domain-containing protein n=1 Tax=Roseococcus sp. SYP-B2431 TaxID=2496640 RepID=UPI00103FF21E|nr:lytic transglycosylase domain-containing protein [Roseococcus sp. SYP-B2431]TCI00604.1 murein transglycosylase [Roseococcus sp. SYP-B2431]
MLLPLFVLFAVLRPGQGWPHSGPGADPALQCRAAIAQAERGAGIPAGLLQAIGRVESGRRNPETGIAGPWPWTLNAEGRGRFFPTREAAIAAVRELQGRGVRIIDVGCMQVNLHHHPRAFANLEEAFDPPANARYAARFLAELQSTRADWMVAAGHYHSQTPDLAQAYRARVQAAWPAEQARAAQDLALAGTRPPAGLSLSNRAERAAVLPSASAGRGRGLDAYRAAPVPVTGRQFALVPSGLIRR